jgi:predicted MPP superfamily phosphohydrolase
MAYSGNQIYRQLKLASFFHRSLNTVAIGKHLVVEQVKISLRNLHPALEGFKIVQMSDLHLDPFFQTDFMRAAVIRANKLQPDLIVLTGDYVTRVGEAIFELAPILAGLNARHGVFAVLGNHDMRERNQAVKTGLRQSGLQLLVNQGVTINQGRGQLYLAGLDDGLWGRPNFRATMENAPNDTPVVLLVHEPDLVDRYALDPRIALQLSGHTHGGQIRLPGIGALTLPDLGRKYDRGLYRVNSTWLYTNRGIGSIRIPVRINCLPEITELTLTASSEGTA